MSRMSRYAITLLIILAVVAYIVLCGLVLLAAGSFRVT
jgi:hypothetical protein